MKAEMTDESVAVLDRLVERSRRVSGLQLPATFVRGSSDGKYMLADLIRGGRGGEVRLKLYLSTVLLAGGRHEHEVYGRNTVVDVSGATWARALAIPDPVGAGARRIADAQDQLASRGLIAVDRRPGQAPRITLLHTSGSGQPWVEPGTPYVTIPLGMWTNRWIWRLSGKELAVLMALLDLCGGGGLDGTGGPQALSGTQRDHYGMSEDTWRIASKALERYGLIETDVALVRADLESPRRRKRYRLVEDGLGALAFY